MAGSKNNQAKVTSKLTPEEQEAKRQINAEKRRQFEAMLEKKFLDQYEVEGKATLTKNKKASILRTMYVLGQDLAMQIENLRGTEGNLRSIKENHLNSLLAAMKVLGSIISEGEFTDKYENRSELNDLFRS